MALTFFDHKVVDPSELHAIVWRTWANAAARTSDTFDPEDIGKVGFQTDNSSIWMLKADSPAAFVRMDAQTTNAAGIAFTPAGGIAATDVQAALAELDSEKQAAGSYLKADGSVLATGDINLNSHKLTNVTDPTSAQDAATKQYVDDNAGGGIAADVEFTPAGNLSATDVQAALEELDSEKQAAGSYLKADGSVTATGVLNMGTNKISGVVDPTSDQDAATKKYVDDNSISGAAADITFTPAGNLAATDVQAALEELDSEKLAVSATTYTKVDGSRAFTGDQSMGSHKLTNVTDPTSAQDAATKAYVDARAAGLRDQKDSVLVASTGSNITLNSSQVVDGVTVPYGSRVFAKDQTTGSENGIWIAGPGTWVRATDFDEDAEVTAGAWIWVESGGSNAHTAWFLATADPIVVGTTALVFQQFADASAVAAGAGMTKSGNTLNVITADGTIVVNADSIQLGQVGLSNIASNLITFAKIAQIASHRFLGNNTGSTANITELTPAQVTAELDVMVGDSGSGGTKGLVPAPASGDAAGNKFLKAGGTWATVDAASVGGVSPSAFVQTLLDDADAKTLLQTIGIGAPHAKFTAPSALSNWTKINQSTSTMADQTGPDGGNTLLIQETGRANFNFRVIAIAVPSAPYTITACIRTVMLYGARLCVGLSLCETSGNNKFIHFSSDQDAINVWKWGSYTGYDSHYFQYNGSRGRDLWWMRIVDDNTNRQFFLSPDGLVWLPFGATSGRTNYFTPTYVGFHCDAGVDANTQGIAQLISWKVT